MNLIWILAHKRNNILELFTSISGGVDMNFLEERIVKDGIVKEGNVLKVDSFLNHQIDTELMCALADDAINYFGDVKVTKVLTIETSGIAVAFPVANKLRVPLVFAKKSKSAINDGSNVYTAEIKSFTRNTVSTVTVDKRFISEGENILIVDDFLAEGNAALGLIDIVKQGKGNVVGMSAAIEKFFQGGHEKIEAMGIPVYCPASIKGFKDKKVVF